MNTKLPDTAIATSGADSAATQPFPNSRKVYVTGSRPDIRVPTREISLADTPTDFGGESNAPVLVYDTSGPYTDPQASIDLRAGLADVPFCRTFSDVTTGESLLLWNSSGYLELAVRNGSAQSMWGFAEGEEVLISRQEV